jgi:hypothetical protein
MRKEVTLNKFSFYFALLNSLTGFLLAAFFINQFSAADDEIVQIHYGLTEYHVGASIWTAPISVFLATLLVTKLLPQKHICEPLPVRTSLYSTILSFYLYCVVNFITNYIRESLQCYYLFCTQNKLEILQHFSAIFLMGIEYSLLGTILLGWLTVSFFTATFYLLRIFFFVKST